MRFLNKNGIIETLKSNLLASLSLCMILFSANGAAAFQNDGTIKIGLIETLTGGAAPYGVAGARGTIMAFEEANASGGIEINGKKVKISVIGDSELGSDGGLDPCNSNTKKTCPGRKCSDGKRPNNLYKFRGSF